MGVNCTGLLKLGERNGRLIDDQIVCIFSYFQFEYFAIIIITVYIWSKLESNKYSK